ncbi:hypothetical protein [Streptomyces sp. 135]|uniref:hypothetical protein n=1 Tax=Streptomyces sp. 135 TaxID=2838850 RepID=UPI001CBBDDE4|nr:hypothetical protein [Streptomyces sp. 135]
MPKTVLSAVLLVLACLLVPLGALSTWAKYEIGDRDSYVATMAPLASDDAVRTAVADEVTGAVMKEIDVGPLQGAVEAFVGDAVRSFTETAAYRTAWDAANRAAYDAVRRAWGDDSDGAVTIDLAPITEQIKRQLADDGVPFASKIPVKHTEVTVMRSSDDLGWLRRVFGVLRSAGLWLPVAAVVLAVAGVLLAASRRRAVVATGLGGGLAAGVLLVGVAVGRGVMLDDLPAEVSRGAAGAVYDALTASLWAAAWVLVGVGLVVALGAWLSPRWRSAPRAGRGWSRSSPRP